MVDILVPSAPKYLQITQTMIEDLLFDPVMAAQVIMGYKLDAFQRARLKIYWWTPNVIDSSGFSTGKTFIVWIYTNLRCLLLPDHWSLVYYQTHQIMKDQYWTYYEKCRAPIFQANFGKCDNRGEEEAKATKKEPATWKAFYKNESIVMCPAPGFLTGARTSASRRANDVTVDEFTKAEMMTKTANGIDDQLLGRLTRPGFNQHHPIWQNHFLFTATAEDSMHPSFKRVKNFRKRIREGNPNYFIFTSSFKDYSNLPCHSGKTFQEEYRIDETIKHMKDNYVPSKYQQEVLGLWSTEGRGFYTNQMIEMAQDFGKRRNLMPIVSRAEDKTTQVKHYFLGVDPAPAQSVKADDGALIILRATTERNEETEACDSPADWVVEPVYAYRVRGASMRQWSGLVHKLHRAFRFDRICVDQGAGGGGGMLKTELSMAKQLIDGQETDCKPICTPDDKTVMVGDFNLCMFSHGDKTLQLIWNDVSRGYDVLNDCAHAATQAALHHGQMAWPHPEYKKEDTVGWPTDKEWSLTLLIKELPNQFKGISIATSNDGDNILLTNHGARQFRSAGHDDFMSAYIKGYTAFLAWLKNKMLWMSDQEDAGFVCETF